MTDTKGTKNKYFQPAFFICVLVLVISVIAMPIVINSFGIYFEKDPLPIRKSLDTLAGDRLGDYKVISKDKIENKEIVESLGTEDYIQWTLEDSSVGEESPLRYFNLFITYYDLPDRVPHVPEECYTGGGYQKVGDDVFTVSYEGEETTKEVPVRYVVFGSKKRNLWNNKSFSVAYFFSVNGVYCNSREDARFTINQNVFSKQLYFSKVEWKFFGNNKLTGVVFPEQNDLRSASEKLLKVLVPLLEKEYWPQIKK